MNREDMFSALGGIDDQYLLEACSFEVRQRKKRARILQMILPAAALMAVLFSLLLTLPLLTRSGESPFLPSKDGVEENPLPSPDAPPPVYSEGLVYEKYEDHAVIVQLQGDGKVAKIPQFLDNLPVTKVELSEGTVPQNYTVISFNGETLEALTLPKNKEMTLELGKNVTHINPVALLNASLTAVTVNESNPVYASFMGILYSKDLSVLIACPSGLKATKLTNEGLFAEEHHVRIPEETRTIADRAFKGNRNLIDVTLPEGIVSIGASAFESCAALRSATLPLSLENVSRNAFEKAPDLGYLHYAGTAEQLSALDTVLPIGCQVYYPLPKTDPYFESNTFIRFFMEAEEGMALFSPFHFLPCDWGIEVDGYYPVTDEDISTLEDLRTHLLKYFDKELVDSVLEKDAQSEEPIFIEIDGALYMMPPDPSVSYADGQRQYSFAENEDGSISVTVRVNVPGTVANICVDCTYLISFTEEGYCFAESFVLPIEKWYPLYLVNAQ
jgi:hypothetical protein